MTAVPKPRVVQGEIATHRNTARRPVAFAEARLVLPPGGTWAGGQWWLIGGDSGETAIGCDALSAMSAGGAVFPVVVEAADGRHGPFLCEGVVADFPPGAGCYLFATTADGHWSGVTVTAAFRRVAIVDYTCDPL